MPLAGELGPLGACVHGWSGGLAPDGTLALHAGNAGLRVLHGRLRRLRSRGGRGDRRCLRRGELRRLGSGDGRDDRRCLGRGEARRRCGLAARRAARTPSSTTHCSTTRASAKAMGGGAPVTVTSGPRPPLASSLVLCSGLRAVTMGGGRICLNLGCCRRHRPSGMASPFSSMWKARHRQACWMALAARSVSGVESRRSAGGAGGAGAGAR